MMNNEEINLLGYESFELETNNETENVDLENKEMNETCIKEYFKCLICFNKVIDPLMCPVCSKFACKNCFIRWIDENKNGCPHCKCTLEVNNLVKVNVISDIYHSLKNLLNKNNINLKDKDDEENNNCTIHKENELIYFCNDCNKEICSDCAIIGEHKNHEIKKIDDIMKDRIELIKIEMKKLSKKIESVKFKINNASQKENQVKKVKEQKFKEIDDFFKNIKIRTDQDHYLKVSKLRDYKNYYKQEKYICESNFINISNTINKYFEKKKRFRSEKILTLLKSLNSKNIIDYDNEITLDYEIDKYFEPIEGEFTLKNYNILKENGELIFSEEIEMDGNRWRLKVYPNGAGKYFGKYLSVFIEMTNGFEEGNYFYKVIMLKTNNSSNHYEKDFVSEFSSNISWGYNRFYKIQNLEIDNFLNEKNEIKFKFIIRPSDFYQKIKDLKNYNNLLKEKLRKKEQNINIENPNLENINRNSSFSNSNYSETSNEINEDLSVSNDNNNNSTNNLNEIENFNQNEKIISIKNKSLEEEKNNLDDKKNLIGNKITSENNNSVVSISDLENNNENIEHN